MAFRFLITIVLLLGAFEVVAVTPTYEQVTKMKGRVHAAEAAFCAPGASAKSNCPKKNDDDAGTGIASLLVAADTARSAADVTRDLAFFKIYDTVSGTEDENSLVYLRSELKSAQEELANYKKRLEEANTSIGPLKTFATALVAGAPLDPLAAAVQAGSAPITKIFDDVIKQRSDRVKTYQTRIAEINTQIAAATTEPEKKSLGEDIPIYQRYIDQNKKEIAKYTAANACLKQVIAANCPTETLDLLRETVIGKKSSAEDVISSYGGYIKEQEAQVALLTKKISDKEAVDAANASKKPKDRDLLREEEQRYKDEIAGMASNSGFQTCGLSTAELLAIRFYTGSGFDQINAALRSGKDVSQWRPIIDEINSGLGKLRAFNGFVVRGGHLPPAVRAQHTVGAIVTYGGFTSTSIDSGFPADDRFVIHSRTGRYIGSFSSSYEESEVLIPNGARFKVLSVTKTSETTTYVLDEVVAPAK